MRETDATCMWQYQVKRTTHGKGRVDKKHRTHLRVNDARLRNRHTKRRASVAKGIVAALLVHYKADVSPGRGDAEQVGRGNKRGGGLITSTTATFITIIIIIIMLLMIPPSFALLQLVSVLDEDVLKKSRSVVVVSVVAACSGSRGGGEGESAPTPEPQQENEAIGYSRDLDSGKYRCRCRCCCPWPKEPEHDPDREAAAAQQREGTGKRSGDTQNDPPSTILEISNFLCPLPPSHISCTTAAQTAHAPIYLPLCLMMNARRVLVLACLFLAAAPLKLASGQEGGVAEAGDGLDLEEVLDSLEDAGLLEVRKQAHDK